MGSNTSVTVTKQWLTVKPQAATASLDMVGTVAPGRSMPVLAPFDGVVREKRHQLGDHVRAGDILVVLDTGEITSRYREAQSAYLKAIMAADTMAQWESGPEVQGARRALESAEAALAMLEHQVGELEALFMQGIIARNEYDGMVQQRDVQITTVASTRDELAAILNRGSSSNLQLVALEVENTQARLADLKLQLAGAEVTSAVAGILIRPPESTASRASTPIEPGASLSRGAPIFSVADTNSFLIIGTIDEIDVNQIQMGQPALIESDAFEGGPLKGTITSVSAEASSKDASDRAPVFEVRASFGTEDEMFRESIRIGMSARMSVEIYTNPQALIVPPDAVIDARTEPKLRIERGGEAVLAPVLLGRTFATGIEVLSGLASGSRILVAR